MAQAPKPKGFESREKRQGLKDIGIMNINMAQAPKSKEPQNIESINNRQELLKEA